MIAFSEQKNVGNIEKKHRFKIQNYSITILYCLCVYISEWSFILEANVVPLLTIQFIHGGGVSPWVRSWDWTRVVLNMRGFTLMTNVAFNYDHVLAILSYHVLRLFYILHLGRSALYPQNVLITIIIYSLLLLLLHAMFANILSNHRYKHHTCCLHG